jgi:LysW-gamma-L-lysine carboxypeptidase
MSELLIELVSRYSPSMQEAPAVAYLVDWMRARGFNAYVDEVGNACGIRGPENAPYTLMLLGHIDTFPGQIPVRVEDGAVYGRGSVDAKGSLCTFAEAASLATIPPHWRVIVIGALEEEVASSKGAHYASDVFTPDMCIIGEPSSSDRITLGYKGRLLLDYTLSRPVSHTARPEPSAGALGAAFWQAIVEWSDKANEGVERYFDQVMYHLRNINTTSDYFNERLSMTVGFRLPPRFPPDEVLQIVSGFAAPGATIRSYGTEHAYQADRNNALVRGMMAAIRAQGQKPGFVLKTGTSDMNIVGVKWKCPIVAYGPGDSNLDHSPNEHLPLAEYNWAVATIKYFIEQLDKP